MSIVVPNTDIPTAYTAILGEWQNKKNEPTPKIAVLFHDANMDSSHVCFSYAILHCKHIGFCITKVVKYCINFLCFLADKLMNCSTLFLFVIIGDISSFLQSIFDGIKLLNIDVTRFICDHMCYRVQSLVCTKRHLYIIVLQMFFIPFPCDSMFWNYIVFVVFLAAAFVSFCSQIILYDIQ